MVDEMYVYLLYLGKIREHPGSLYQFSVNRRFSKPDAEPKAYINVNSDGLRAIALQALEDGGNPSANSILGE